MSLRRIDEATGVAHVQASRLQHVLLAGVANTSGYRGRVYPYDASKLVFKKENSIVLNDKYGGTVVVSTDPSAPVLPDGKPMSMETFHRLGMEMTVSQNGWALFETKRPSLNPNVVLHARWTPDYDLWVYATLKKR